MNNTEEMAVQTFSIVPEAYQQIFVEYGADFPDDLVSAIKDDPQKAAQLLEGDKQLKNAVVEIFKSNKETILQAAQQAQNPVSVEKNGRKLSYLQLGGAAPNTYSFFTSRKEIPETKTGQPYSTWSQDRGGGGNTEDFGEVVKDPNTGLSYRDVRSTSWNSANGNLNQEYYREYVQDKNYKRAQKKGIPIDVQYTSQPSDSLKNVFNKNFGNWGSSVNGEWQNDGDPNVVENYQARLKSMQFGGKYQVKNGTFQASVTAPGDTLRQKVYPYSTVEMQTYPNGNVRYTKYTRSMTTHSWGPNSKPNFLQRLWYGKQTVPVEESQNWEQIITNHPEDPRNIRKQQDGGVNVFSQAASIWGNPFARQIPAQMTSLNSNNIKQALNAEDRQASEAAINDIRKSNIVSNLPKATSNYQTGTNNYTSGSLSPTISNDASTQNSTNYLNNLNEATNKLRKVGGIQENIY